MTVKEQLKMKIDLLDDHYLDLLYRIVCQFPHDPDKAIEAKQGKDIASLFKEIADSGGLGIKDPQEWQRNTREDRSLPFRKM